MTTERIKLFFYTKSDFVFSLLLLIFELASLVFPKRNLPCLYFISYVKNRLIWAIFTGRNEVVAKVMFLQVCVCPQWGRVSASVRAGMPDPHGPARHPPRTTPPGTSQTPTPPPPRTSQTPIPPPPGPGRHPLPPGPGRHPPPPGTRQTPPRTRQTLSPREADSSIRSTNGRYASYWNAFLYQYIFITKVWCIETIVVALLTKIKKCNT